MTVLVYGSEFICSRIMPLLDAGVEAISFVCQEGKYADADRPDLTLLDLNVPEKDGREVLDEIKQDQKLKSIPVVVITALAAESDIAKTDGLHANCYITKPVDLEQFIEVVKYIDCFCLAIMKLPQD